MKISKTILIELELLNEIYKRIKDKDKVFGAYNLSAAINIIVADHLGINPQKFNFRKRRSDVSIEAFSFTMPKESTDDGYIQEHYDLAAEYVRSINDVDMRKWILHESEHRVKVREILIKEGNLHEQDN